MLVCLASATFAVVTVAIISMPIFFDPHVQANPVRLVEAITAGVAFLAAGFIIFKRTHVRGLSTDVGMWLAAAIDLAVGVGPWIIALLACFLGAVVLAVLRRLEMRFALKEPPEPE